MAIRMKMILIMNIKEMDICIETATKHSFFLLLLFCFFFHSYFLLINFSSLFYFMIITSTNFGKNRVHKISKDGMTDLIRSIATKKHEAGQSFYVLDLATTERLMDKLGLISYG